MMLDLSQNLVHFRWILKLVSLSIFTSSSEPPIYILTYNETPYDDLTIRAVISDEFFQNLNIWYVKVLLVNYATVEIH
ncbi:hypothetical protein Goshw_012961 [Gossypium schwendimanii]|uniref:Plastocyanin-like domain-containing protein n=1 Tax=Gossypium schwendimanii TaxID=34291 RepID=A0A7J9L2N8_GOSSC|nr:hypothetical protein [Gossypium schwendimanii]